MTANENGGRRPDATPTGRHQHDRLRSTITRQRTRRVGQWPAAIDPVALAALVTCCPGR